jgi:hypothetical protein
MFKIKKNKGGFSLLESILSIFLVSMGLVVSIKLLTLGVSQSMKNRDQFIASLLAQEGVELVRNMRDNTWVDNIPDTGSFYYFPANYRERCITDINNIGIIDSSSGRCGGPDMQLFLKNGYYVDSINANPKTATKYYRRIKFSYCNSSGTCGLNQGPTIASVLVTSLVSWNGNAPNADETNCNTATSCAYTQITLNKWGE